MALVYPEMAYSVIRPSIRPGPEPGLVGAWDLGDPVEGVVYDLSGNGNDGTLHGGPVAVHSPLGMGMLFDGIDAYVGLSMSCPFHDFKERLDPAVVEKPIIEEKT